MNGKSDLRLQSFISDILQRRKSLWLSFYSFMYDILSLNLSRDWVLFLTGKKKKEGNMSGKHTWEQLSVLRDV